ncbi:MAG: hypothetical protein B6D43_02000 [Ignavibacteriales bacterium UTCHB1]|nr:MAG: hypothetical protein B6D43_02000 [Ignavibacteriales bacterium UTCHB1]
MVMRKDFSSMVELLRYLKSEGYTENFNLRENCIVCSGREEYLPLDQFKIVDFFRFEGESNPDDSSIVYAIESKDGLKGVLVNAYGTYSDPLSDLMVEKLSIKRNIS